MPLASAIRVLEDSIAGNVADVRSNILANRKWFTNLLKVTYGAKIQLDARLRERPGALALKSTEIPSNDLCRILGLHCKLVVHGCALELMQEERDEKQEKDLFFPSPLMKMVGWATTTVFRCHSNTTNTLGSMSAMSSTSSMSAISSVSNRLSGVGLHSVGSSPLPSGPRSRRRRSVGSNPRRLSGGSVSSGGYVSTKYTQLSRDVAVVVTGIVADCALLGFMDRANFIVSNVDMWENAFKRMLEEGGNNAVLKEEMKKLVKWCKKIKGKHSNGGNNIAGKSHTAATLTTSAISGKGVVEDGDEDRELNNSEEEDEEEEDEDPFAEFERELEESRIMEEGEEMEDTSINMTDMQTSMHTGTIDNTEEEDNTIGMEDVDGDL